MTADSSNVSADEIKGKVTTDPAEIVAKDYRRDFHKGWSDWEVSEYTTDNPTHRIQGIEASNLEGISLPLLP